MSSLLKVGDILYHKTDKIKCEITQLDDLNMKVKLEHPICEKLELELPIKHMGEWLFFNKDDIELTLAEISKINDYIKYGNHRIELYLKELRLQMQCRTVQPKYEEASPSRFTIYKNNFLTKNIIAYYNRPYTGYGNQDNPVFLNTLKNTFNKETLSQLYSARQEVENILLVDLPKIINQHNFQNCVCVCIPRAKALNTYTDNQLFLRDAIRNASNKINGIVDGTDVIIRHTNTFTTHLEKATADGRIQNNDGDKPYPGITKATSYIKKDKIIGRRIILIDDIYTKGVNIDEDCIQALLDNGAQEVIFYAIGRTGGN